MANGNVRVRERFELALDGGQIAAIVVGALVTVSAVFVLGLKMGQHLATQQAVALRPGADLAALDQPPVNRVAAPAPVLRYEADLPTKKPAAPPPIEPARPPAAAATATTAPPPSPPPPPAAVRSQPTGEVVLPALSAPAPEPTAAPVPAPTGKGFTVQLASAQSRDDANKVVAKVKSHGPRVVEADVPGKGHFFRVRVGRFDSRDAAERFRDDLARETGMKGLVMPE
jgi:cell division septation protein DedD